MILIIGGLGFVGSNTAQAMLEAGEDCVLTQHRSDQIPAFLENQVDKRIFIEKADVADMDALLALAKKHKITGIVNLVTGGIPTGTTAVQLVNDIHSALTSIANTVQVAHEWGVKRVTFSSAPVIYNGIKELPWYENQPLPMTAAYSMEAAKKCSEIVSSYLSTQTHVECIEARLAAMYGPHYDPTRSNFVGRLVHSAVKGEKPSLEGLRFSSAHAADASDQIYVKDAARAMALLQTADKLNHQVYNVSSGRPTTNQAIVDAIKEVIPNFDVELPSGRESDNPVARWYFDITRLQKDTGFEAHFNIQAGVADYIAWLRAGNKR